MAGDARDQSRFRQGEHETALAGYAERGRLTLHPTQQAAEDAALEAAHQDQRDGHRTLVIAQTSNEPLDELNARAQALRQQDGQLGAGTLELAGRPYRLQSGDRIQLRASIPHPEHGTIRNGTTATITTLDPDPDADTAQLALGDDRQVTLTREQLDQAQARLAYMQHPFPAQGTTTDTAHLIIAERPTREGTYVALTRARQSSHIHASTEHLNPDHEPLPQLAELVSATDPDLPSISLPLAHEHAIQHELDRASRPAGSDLERERTGTRPRPLADASAEQSGFSRSVDDQPERRAAPAHRHDRDGTAAAITAYRTTYGMPSPPTALPTASPTTTPGRSAPSRPADTFRQRLDRRQAAHDTLNLLRDNDSERAVALREQLLQIEDRARGLDEHTIGHEL